MRVKGSLAHSGLYGTRQCTHLEADFGHLLQHMRLIFMRRAFYRFSLEIPTILALLLSNFLTVGQRNWAERWTHGDRCRWSRELRLVVYI